MSDGVTSRYAVCVMHFASRWVPVALLFSVAPGFARADVVEDMPIDCPGGATYSPSHCGPVCLPRSCTTDSDCAAGTSCGMQSYCVDDMSCGGWGGELRAIRATCDSPCLGTSTCQPLRVCLPDAPRPDAGTTTPPVRPDAGGGSDAGTGPSVVRYGCGCRVTRTPSGALGGLALVGLALGLRRRRAK